MIVLELRVAKFVAESLQIGIPLQFADAETKPIGEVADVFDSGKVPVVSGCHRLHALRFGDPFGDCDFVAIFHAGVDETRVVSKELKNIAVTWPRLPGERFNVPPGQGPEPAPAASQRSHGARLDIIND